MARPPRSLLPAELALWHHIVRDVAPLRAGEEPSPPAEPEAAPAPPPGKLASPAAAAPAPASLPRPPLPRPSQRLDPHHPIDLDRGSWKRLRRGTTPIDARLDLHGLTQAQAHERLASFLLSAHARGNRCVLVITGRGLRHGGTLRSMTPRWLDEAPVRGLVLAYAQAQIHHGGEGALYVLLRRR